MAGQLYTDRLKADGGTNPLEWAITDGAMPLGLRLDEVTGAISGKQKSEGVVHFTVQVTDAKGVKSNEQSFSLSVSPKLEITTELGRDPRLGEPPGDFIADLHTEGGLQSYKWKLTHGTILPDGIEIQEGGRIHGKADPGIRRTTRFMVQCTDEGGYSDTASFAIKVGHPRKPWGVGKIPVTVKPSLPSILFHTSNYLAVLGFTLPAFGAIWIAVYSFTAPGRPGWGCLGVGLLTAFTAFLVGGLGGFLFGIPKLVSSGELRQKAGPRYSPSTNLAEVSDWLTKLLLGAGLVQLTHLGAPVGSLIDDVARGLAASPKPRKRRRSWLEPFSSGTRRWVC